MVTDVTAPIHVWCIAGDISTWLDKSWDLHVVSNEMPPSGDIRTQPTHRPSSAVEGANYCCCCYCNKYCCSYCYLRN